MFSSRFFVGLLIPAIILGFAVWFVFAADIDRGDVKVAGALVGAPDVRFTVDGCTVTEAGGTRSLLVKLEAFNRSTRTVELYPRDFHLVLVRKKDPAALERQRTFTPMQYRSSCPDAPLSTTAIPPSSTRSVELVFWGGNMPRGGEWDEHVLSLEYYDAVTPLLFSKVLTPKE